MDLRAFRDAYGYHDIPDAKLASLIKAKLYPDVPANVVFGKLFNKPVDTRGFQQYDPSNAQAQRQIGSAPIGVVMPNNPYRAEAEQRTLANVAQAMTDPMLIGSIGKLSKRELAHLTAQKNAALPISEGGLGLPPNNTALDRAKAMGGIDVYHGTASDIQQIDPSKFGDSTKAHSAKQGFWVVDSPSTAHGYAQYAANDVPVKRLLDEADKFEKKGDWDAYDEMVRQAEELEAKFADNPANGQNIMPMTIIPKRLQTMDAGGQEFTDLEGGVNKFLALAKAKGADVAEIKNLADDVGFNGRPANHYAVLNPSSLRSRFAAFDPKRKHEADLMASLAAMLSLGYLKSQSE